MNLISPRRVALLALFPFMSACGSSTPTPVVVASPTPFPVPTPAPSPTPAAFACPYPARPDLHIECPKLDPKLSSYVNTAIENVIAQQPHLFDFNNNLGVGQLESPGPAEVRRRRGPGHPRPGHLREGRQRGDRGQEHQRLQRAIQHLDLGRLRPPRLHHDLRSRAVLTSRLNSRPRACRIQRFTAGAWAEMCRRAVQMSRNTFGRAVVSGLMVATLATCGGGGPSTPTTSPSAPPAQQVRTVLGNADFTLRAG